MSGELREAALDYARLGWPVFPLGVRGKLPMIAKADGGKGCHDATTDPGLIEIWWKRWPEANIGITCCAASFFALDIDPKHGGDEAMRDIVARFGRLPATVTARTGSGGWHYYFRAIPDFVLNSVGRIGAGIDTRGGERDGYVVAPPSVHPDGPRYEWISGRAPGEVEVEPAPLWLLTLYREAPGLARRVEGVAVRNDDFWSNLFATGAKEGARNDALVRMAGHLMRSRLNPWLVLEIMKLWNEHKLSPPGDPTKLEEIVNRVAGKELDRIVKRRARGRKTNVN